MPATATRHLDRKERLGPLVLQGLRDQQDRLVRKERRVTLDPQERTELTDLVQQASVLLGRLEQLGQQVGLVQQDLQESMELVGQLVLQVNEAKWAQWEREAQREPLDRPEPLGPRGQLGPEDRPELQEPEDHKE